MSFKRKINLILDLQFGSTGKGLIAGFLAERDQPDTVVTAWAANAGHTYIDSQGRKFVHTMLANGIVSKNIKRVLIGPGSVLDLDNLQAEIKSAVELLGDSHPFTKAEILIHENAAVIYQRHRDEEAGPMTKIGSTKKGCGAAAIQRIRRDPDDLNTARAWEFQIRQGQEAPGSELHSLGVRVVTVEEYNNALDMGRKIQIEGAQGYSLSMYHGFYPYCTSRDVSTAQVLADCAIPLSWKFGSISVIGTARTYPIRVANRFDEKGSQVGWSGPAFPDQEEISFDKIGQEVELTTVTKLPRRIFTFSPEQIRRAVRQNGVSEIFLNFANYCKTPEELASIIAQIDSTGAQVRFIGMGPTIKDVFDVNDGNSIMNGHVEKARYVAHLLSQASDSEGGEE